MAGMIYGYTQVSGKGRNEGRQLIPLRQVAALCGLPQGTFCARARKLGKVYLCKAHPTPYNPTTYDGIMFARQLFSSMLCDKIQSLNFGWRNLQRYTISEWRH